MEFSFFPKSGHAFFFFNLQSVNFVPMAEELGCEGVSKT